jgi:hypothetical protein
VSDRTNTDRQVAYARARQAEVAEYRALTEPEADDREPTASERQAAYARRDSKSTESASQRQANAATRRGGE